MKERKKKGRKLFLHHHTCLREVMETESVLFSVDQIMWTHGGPAAAKQHRKLSAEPLSFVFGDITVPPASPGALS